MSRWLLINLTLFLSPVFVFLCYCSFRVCKCRPDLRSARIGGRRRLFLILDSAQYYADIESGVDCYASLNLLVRRKPKENNFKSVLETVRDLLNEAAVERSVPPWMRDILLGYGNPSAAHYRYRHLSNNVFDFPFWCACVMH